MIRLKIVQKGWEGYSGPFGATVFKDGIAEASQIEAMRVGALVRVVALDEEGNELGPVSPAHEIVRSKSISAEVIPSRKIDEDEDTTYVRPAPSPPPVVEGEEPTERWTQETLEKIADEQGISGLREIGDSFDVKARTVPELISKILSAQNARA